MITRLILFLLAGAAGGCAPADRELAGTWRLTHSISRGEETHIATAAAPLRFFDGRIAETRHVSSVTGKPYEVVSRARYSVDRSRSPKMIEIEYVEGAGKGMGFHGIYEISGDAMKICVTLNGGPSPTGFESPVGSDTNVDFYERVR